ncbi:MAG: hypothetical protein ACYCYP_11465 [Leptospirales bacterium]
MNKTMHIQQVSASARTGKRSGIMSFLRRPFFPLIVLSLLVVFPGCEYEIPEQPTVFIAQKTPDHLSELLANRKSHLGKLAILGGQIIRRFDTPVGRYFLIRALPLTDDSFPKAPSGPIKNRAPKSRDSFILFAPLLRMVGNTKPMTKHEQSAFVVFGQNNNKTLVIGPGHLVTAVGEVRGMTLFPPEKTGTRYLLLVSHYIILWSKAHPEDYPLVPLK